MISAAAAFYHPATRAAYYAILCGTLVALVALGCLIDWATRRADRRNRDRIHDEDGDDGDHPPVT